MFNSYVKLPEGIFSSRLFLSITPSWRDKFLSSRKTKVGTWLRPAGNDASNTCGAFFFVAAMESALHFLGRGCLQSIEE